MLCVEFAEQRHFDTRTGFIFFAVEFGGENLGIVKHEEVAFVEVVDHVAEHFMLDVSCFTVDDHQACFVAFFCRVKCDKFFGQFEFELRKFHFAVAHRVQ